MLPLCYIPSLVPDIMANLRLPALVGVLVLGIQHVAGAVIAGPALTCKTISDTVSSASNVIYPRKHPLPHIDGSTS